MNSQSQADHAGNIRPARQPRVEVTVGGDLGDIG